MILCKLSLENFKKYTSYSIEFEQGLVGIIGKNGSGKSTIFEAILFALYGELKNKGYKEVIRNANATTKDAVVVELDFEFDSAMYRVHREFRGKALSANAKLYKNEELITSGAKEVTSSIVNLVKMNKDAFLHTLFASQKELTSLSSLKNEDRKKMIRKLLGLEKIDFIEKELVEKSRELRREISVFKEVLLGCDEVDKKKETIAQLSFSKIELEKESVIHVKDLEGIKLLEQKIKNDIELFVKAKQQKQESFSSLKLLENTINSTNLNKNKLAIELENLQKKQIELNSLKDVKQKYIQTNEKINELEKLKEYSLKKEGLQKEQDSLRTQYKKSKDTISLLEEDTKEYDSFKNEVSKEEQNKIKLNEELRKSSDAEKKILQDIAGEQKLIKDINQKIENIQKLGKDSNCPTCTRPLLDEYDYVLSSLDDVVQEAKKEKINLFQKELERMQKEKKQIEDEQAKNNQNYMDVSKSLNLCQSKMIDLKKEKEYFVSVKEKGLTNKQELEKLSKYAYDKKEHSILIEKQQEQKSKYEYVLSLETMLERLSNINEDLQKISENILSHNAQYKVKELEFKAINYDETKHNQKQNEHDETQKQKDDKTIILNDKKVKIATINGEIKTINESLESNNKQQQKVQTKKDDRNDYEKIKISLGEFKTKLNSKIAPRISSIASEMYSIITKGKYQHIEVSNDFDFYIYDEGKRYPVERFSGGEIDLANLVLRIAISKTLGELSGSSSVGFLAFDEVFGSQDETRRMQILEAFHMIKEQYRQIFLISHEMEIKEMFERVIEL